MNNETRAEIDALIATITGNTFADRMRRNSLRAFRERFPETPEPEDDLGGSPS